MKDWWKKFIAWMKYEGEEPTWVWTQNRYSENIKRLPIHGDIGPDDILQLSHKLEDDKWETCYVTVKQLKDAIAKI